MIENFTAIQSAITPEKSLLVAMLRRALFDYFGGAPEEKSSAREWFFPEEDQGALFSFEYVCSHLGFDAESIRFRLRGAPKKMWEKATIAA